VEKIYLGYASGIAAGDEACKDGPLVLSSSYPVELLFPKRGKNKYQIVAELCLRLAKKTQRCIKKKQFFTVFGGDHSCAIGTWSGVSHALREEGDIGLIWIDAHLDAHTHRTTPSGNIHGMPVAALLGQGHASLTRLLDRLPKIKPENLCMIGMRSYEKGELDLIKKLKIKVFYQKEVDKKGFEKIFQQAQKSVCKNTIGYGISLDLDGIDPKDAPAVGTPEEKGLPAKTVINTFKKYCQKGKHPQKLLGLEITEFNPHRDIKKRTEKLVHQLLKSVEAS
jgi:arginase